MLTHLCRYLMPNLRRFRIHNRRRGASRRTPGQVIVIFALALTVLLLFIGLAIDAGSLYVTYGHLKRAVDSASVAAANAYRGTQIFPVGTPMSTIMATNYAKIKGAAVETFALDGLQVDPTDQHPGDPNYGPGIGNLPTNIHVYICDSNGDGYRDGDTGDTSGVTLPPDFFAICPATTPTNHVEGRKLVYVAATVSAPTYFLSLFHWYSIPLTSSTIAEAAPLDLVIALDTSGSMGKDTPGWNSYDYDPTGCNTNNSCEPLASAKTAAETLINTLYQGYDRVSIITFDQYAIQVTGTASTPFVSVNDALAEFNLVDSDGNPQHNINLHYDAPIGRLWPNWNAGNEGGKKLFNPMNPEDMDGDGLDGDNQSTGPRADHPYQTDGGNLCPDLNTLDPGNPNTGLMAYQIRWWDDGSGTGDSGIPDVPAPPSWWSTHYGGAPCDSKNYFDSYNWLNAPRESFSASANDTAIRNWMVDPSVNFGQNVNALAYYLGTSTGTFTGPNGANSLLPNATRETTGYQRYYHDVAGRLLSNNSTCTGCAIRYAFNDFNNDGRNNATWVMVMLSDGSANVTDQPAQYPEFFSDTNTTWDLTLDTSSKHTQFANGFCEGFLDDGNLWSNGCAESNPPTSIASGSTYTNIRYCIKENQYKDGSGVIHSVNQCPPDLYNGKTHVVHLDSTQLHDVNNRMKYGPIQYAMDMIDMLALQKSSNPNEKVAPFGDKKVGVYTIAYGKDTVASYNFNGTVGIPEGEELLRYIASVGDDGDRTTNPCDGVPNSSYNAVTHTYNKQSCGNYYFAGTTSDLTTIFEDIAKRIQTRISY